MNTIDLVLTILIISIFFGLYAFNIFLIGKKNIESNWVKYRCNPIFMPFASFFNQDTNANFSYCIQNMQSTSMPKFLEPLNYINEIFVSILGDTEQSIQQIRKFINQIRNFTKKIISSVMGIFLNIFIEIQRLIITVIDLFGRLLAMMTVTGGIVGGSTLLANSVWEGPPGQTVRQIGSLCFDKNTLLKIGDGSIVKMKNINLGEKLKNGSTVIGKMFISNYINNNYIDELYSISYGEKNKNIIVTGSHLIYDKNINNFVYVKDYDKSIKLDYNKKELCCLITSDHTIPIGEYIFHDWEDNTDIVKNIN